MGELALAIAVALGGLGLTAAPAPTCGGGASTCGDSAGSCSSGTCGGNQTGGSCTPVPVLEKLKSFPPEVWEQASREFHAEEAAEAAGEHGHAHAEAPPDPRPPSDPAAYAEALSKVLTAPGYELFEFARYKGELPVENLGSDSKLGQAPVRMASLSIAAPLAEVQGTYAESMRARGLPVFGFPVSENSAYLAYRGQDGFMRTLTLIEMDGQTVALAAVGDPAKMAAGQDFLDDWPMPPTDGTPLDLRQAEGAQVQLSRNATVFLPTPGNVIEFYKNGLPPLGWKLEDKSELKDEQLRSATFARGDQRCTVSAVPAAEGRSFMSALCVVRR